MSAIDAAQAFARWTLASAAAALLACGCDVGASRVLVPERNAPQALGNLLVIVADDVGVDMIGAYGEHPEPAPTPNIDALAARGVLFRNAYANPWCSPTRATLLTGRYSLRTGIGAPLVSRLDRSLPPEEITLPELLDLGLGRDIDTALVGKWHLGHVVDGSGHPRQHGFDHFAGTIANLPDPNGFKAHYKIDDEAGSRSTRYATTEQVDDALRLVRSMREPWFFELCFNAAHQPFHAPPPELHTRKLSGDPSLTPREHYLAAVEAMDTEIGRLLASLDAAVLERTTVLFLGDNGSPNEVVSPPSLRQRSKGTLYEGGVRVPLIAAGRGVSAQARECAALVNTVDLFPTAAELFGVDAASVLGERKLDGVSLRPYFSQPDAAPRRAWVYVERFWPNGPGPYDSVQRAIRDERWKLCHDSAYGDRFFDLGGRRFEESDLLEGELDPEQRAAYERLARELALLVGS